MTTANQIWKHDHLTFQLTINFAVSLPSLPGSAPGTTAGTGTGTVSFGGNDEYYKQYFAALLDNKECVEKLAAINFLGIYFDDNIEKIARLMDSKVNDEIPLLRSVAETLEAGARNFFLFILEKMENKENTGENTGHDSYDNAQVEQFKNHLCKTFNRIEINKAKIVQTGGSNPD